MIILPVILPQMKKWIELAEPNPPSAILIAVQDNQIVWEGLLFNLYHFWQHFIV